MASHCNQYGPPEAKEEGCAHEVMQLESVPSSHLSLEPVASSSHGPCWTSFSSLTLSYSQSCPLVIQSVLCGPPSAVS